VLDQLLGGAAESGVSYRQAAALLGYTPDSLLDEFVDAFAAGDAGGVFACVDKVIEVGQDPRRFAEDLLRRLRDLVIVAAVPDALTSGLVDVAADQAERLSSQAASLGAGELTRAAEVIATGLTDMRGTTAPRLHLELMCARVLLPGADTDDRGVHARLDRLERRIGIAEVTSPVRSEPPTSRSEPVGVRPEPVNVRPEPVEGPSVEQASTSSAGRSPHPEPVDVQPDPAEVRPEPVEGRAEGASTSAVLSSSKGAVLSSSKGSAPISPQLTVTDVRRLWPEVLEEVKGKRRFTWILLSQNAQVAELRNDTLLLAMSNAGARDSFARGGSEDVLREAMVVVMGADFAVETMVDPGAAASAGAPRTPPADEQPHDPTRPKPDSSRTRAANGVRMDPPEDPDAVASRDDSDLEEDAESHAELLARHLGAEIIAEEDHGA
jgi:DNA polymerase-3 subunit gamma/tau